jgi:hypothetical protein
MKANLGDAMTSAIFVWTLYCSCYAYKRAGKNILSHVAGPHILLVCDGKGSSILFLLLRSHRLVSVHSGSVGAEFCVVPFPCIFRLQVNMPGSAQQALNCRRALTAVGKSAAALRLGRDKEITAEAVGGRGEATSCLSYKREFHCVGERK